jgi:uncharacterized protein
MTFATVLLLVCAGFVGGMANAMAGGASLVTFPALMAAGLAPIPANASNAVAVVFGNLVGAWTERHKLPPFTPGLWVTCGAAAVGGMLGAFLLLVTPENVFTAIVPVLIGAATAVFAFSASIQRLVMTRLGQAGQNLQTALVFPATIYGGYFGAGLGVILMAVLSSTSSRELRSNNAVKNVLGVLTNATAIVIFIWQGMIVWPQTLVMMAACIAGGYAGANALRWVSAATMKKTIITIGIAMTVYYVWRYWLA